MDHTPKKSSQTTRDRMNGRPFMKAGISTSDIAKFKTLDTSKYTAQPKARKISRSPFDAGLGQIRTTFE